MARGVARYLVGSFVLLGLAACGRSFLAEREPWRHEAEVACLKSGQVKEGASIVRIAPISGPGTCGADFPLKVSAFGDSDALGYTDELRPPGAVPRGRQPLAAPPPGVDPIQTIAPYQPSRARRDPVDTQASGPVSIRPPGVDDPDVDEEGAYQFGTPAAAGSSPPAMSSRAPSYPPAERVPLGRERVSPVTAAIAVKPAATLACPIVSSLDKWLTEDVQPAAMRWFGSPLVEIRQFSAYSCRTVNNQGRSLSEHAFGNALDVAIFNFANGRKVNVEHGWRGAPEEQGFLRDIHKAACKHFATVLGPGADVFHYNHFHFDMRKRANGYTICRPNPVAGDAIAGRATPRQGEVTGSIRPKSASTRMPTRRGRDDDGLPSAIPGED